MGRRWRKKEAPVPLSKENNSWLCLLRRCRLIEACCAVQWINTHTGGLLSTDEAQSGLSFHTSSSRSWIRLWADALEVGQPPSLKKTKNKHPTMTLEVGANVVCRDTYISLYNWFQSAATIQNVEERYVSLHWLPVTANIKFKSLTWHLCLNLGLHPPTYHFPICLRSLPSSEVSELAMPGGTITIDAHTQLQEPSLSLYRCGGMLQTSTWSSETIKIFKKWPLLWAIIS